jgi:NAD(P)H dehydrogenase (quinone)
VVLKQSGEVTGEDVRGAGGVLIGTPVHWQTMSGETRKLVDGMGQWLGKELGEGKAGGVFCTSGTASNGADVTRLGVIAALLSMRFVVVGGVIEGGYGSLGAQGYGEIGEDERNEARRFGERFGRVVLKMHQK